MPAITSTTQPIKNCFQAHYSLPSFQREYKWEYRHFIELVNDIQTAFLGAFNPEHGRKEVSSYPQYFVGSIITSALQHGKKPIIDGQQRLTSIFILLSYLSKYIKDSDRQNTQDLEILLGSLNYGEMDYRVEFSDSRKQLFQNYLNKEISHSDAIQQLELGDYKDIGDQRIIGMLRQLPEELEDDVTTHLPYFVDYLLERVELIEISVPTESEAHRVFVTMNDRGLRLSPVDLLKGQILSKIPDPESNRSCHERWVEIVVSLKSIGIDDEADFFKSYFRAQWAESVRGKARGDEAKDFEIIGDSYHRWFEENTTKLHINNADDYINFVEGSLKKFSEVYLFIRKAEDQIKPGFESIYYNARRNFTLQPMVLMSAISDNDPETTWKSKIKLTSSFFDLLLSARTADGKENRYDTLRDIAFAYTKKFRNKSKENLFTEIQTEWPIHFALIDKFSSMKYNKSDRSDILFLLARIAVYIEEKSELTNRTGFDQFWKRDRQGKTFDIEHLLKDTYIPSEIPASDSFSDAKEYSDLRNDIGALALLGRSRNRSLNDKSYSDKIRAYNSENILCQTLTPDFYVSNPAIDRFIEAHPGIPLKPIPEFGKGSILERKALYSYICKKIWETPTVI